VRLVISATANAELENAIAYYEREAGLGGDFILEYEDALERILAFPLAWTPLGRSYRRFVLKRFPYQIVFRVSKNRIHVVGVVNTESAPRKW
jgi:hypothetical protein